jgi:hypothetical protein
MKKLLFASLTAATLITCTAAAANSLISPGPRAKIAKSSFRAEPNSEWNRLSARPGANTEIWTLDGDKLNKVTFYGGIAEGQPLFREINKKEKPLPRVSGTMLITDIPVLVENSYRIQLNTVQMAIDSMEPATVGGHKGVRFTYSFMRADDEVRRKGEAIGAIAGKKLYLVTYEAPEIHYFDRDVEKFRQLASTVKF